MIAAAIYIFQFIYLIFKIINQSMDKLYIMESV